MRLPLVLFVATALAVGGCADDSGTSEPSSSSTAITSTITADPPAATTSGAAGTTTTSTSTTAPAPTCESDEAIAVVDEAIAGARLPATTAWSTDAATGFADRTTTGDEYAARLGLDCGLLVAAVDATDQRLAIVAWTGPRMAFAIQATDAPASPYRPDAVVRNPVSDERGEFLADDMSLWAVTGPLGESIVLGHVDYSLGAAAKGWAGGTTVEIDDEVNLASEQHGLDALRAAGMRNVGIAESPQLGSEEGYVQFISATGQISVADVAPTDWFDPMQPRYYTGETSTQSIGGVDVRVTMPNPDDNLGFALAAEVAFACDDFVWILQPPFNGTVDEMLASATAVIATQECRAG